MFTALVTLAMSTSQALASATPADWRALDPGRTLYMEVPGGRVVIELAPEFAPAHVANLRALTRDNWFSGTTINRVQDNYVVQWGDATEAKPLASAAAKLRGEFDRPAAGVAFMAIPQKDSYAAEVGFVDGFAAARDGATGRAWLAHCYATVGVGRGEATDSGNGSELYAVIGHAPRHLDRNYTAVGRVVQGIELLSALPRGTAQLGFYAQAAQRVPVGSVRFAADIPASERTELEVMRTDSAAFAAFVDARAHRSRDGFIRDAGGVDLCNIRVPVRAKAAR
jgi:peptidylprolyl isomerase